MLLDKNGLPFAATPDEVGKAGADGYTLADSISVSQVLSSLEMPIRSRQLIYERWLYMMSDPVISQALKLHVTNTLGAHETSGDVIFIETAADAKEADRDAVKEIAETLSPLINSIAYATCFMALGCGDAYVRIRTKAGKGVVQLDNNMAFYLPPLVQPFERGGQTAGFLINVADKEQHSLSLAQMARMKMPRLRLIPQQRMQFLHWRSDVQEDDVDKLPLLPAMVGGSLCEPAEKPFNLLQSSLLGLNSSRIVDSVRESLLGINMTDMTKEQRREFMSKLTEMLSASKERTRKALSAGKPVLERLYNILPTWQDKQIYSIDSGGSLSGSGTATTYNVDDVMFYAKLLAGSLGIDLSMLGFAEILSGGLGEGGFFRVSAQAGEVARNTRQALTEFINQIIDVHMYAKYGGVFSGKRPYTINFVGATSSLELENQEVRERKGQASITTLQIFDQIKNLGVDEKWAAAFLRDQLGYDEDDAVSFSKFVNAKPENEEGDQ